MISNEEWEFVQKKYGSLIYMIAHRIGGDKITNDFDDSVQEIRMSAMDAIRTYKKKTDVPFDKFFITKDFDKYIKTCLWNRKNSNGIMNCLWQMILIVEIKHKLCVSMILHLSLMQQVVLRKCLSLLTT